MVGVEFYFCFKVMQKTLRSEVNWIDYLTLRIGFSILAGWILFLNFRNISYFLSSIIKPDNTFILLEHVDVVLLFVAMVIYVVVTVYEKNPLFGLVYEWVIFCILTNE